MTTTRRSRMITKIVSGTAGLGLAAIAVLGFSNAAFHAETDNAGNNWATEGFVTLTDDHEAPLFSVGLNGADKPITGEYDSELAAGESISGRETVIDYGGKADADIRLFVDPGYVATRQLDVNTDITVERDGEVIYSGTLADMPNSYAEAAATAWVVGPEADSSTYTFSIGASQTAQDGATLENVKFIWAAEQAA